MNDEIEREKFYKAWFKPGLLCEVEDNEERALAVWLAAKREAETERQAAVVDEATIRDCANELDQLFRQRHTHKDIEAVLHGLIRVPVVWQPIESATEKCIVANINNARLYWAEAAIRGTPPLNLCWYTLTGKSIGTPTHWIPLPEAHSAQGERQEGEE